MFLSNYLKIFVENERARLTKKLADIYESQGKTKDAAEILQELQVNLIYLLKYFVCLFIYYFRLKLMVQWIVVKNLNFYWNKCAYV